MKKRTEVVAALIWDGGRFMICQRPAHKARGLLWEFVGGKVEPGETKPAALARECREELGVEVEVGGEFMAVTTISRSTTASRSTWTRSSMYRSSAGRDPAVRFLPGGRGDPPPHSPAVRRRGKMNMDRTAAPGHTARAFAMPAEKSRRTARFNKTQTTRNQFENTTALK